MSLRFPILTLRNCPVKYFYPGILAAAVYNSNFVENFVPPVSRERKSTGDFIPGALKHAKYTAIVSRPVIY